MEFCFLFSLDCKGLPVIFHSHYKTARDEKHEDDSTEAQVPLAGLDFLVCCSASCSGQLRDPQEVQE